jgi:unsaturated chondroitin disaccharide hydrolase
MKRTWWGRLPAIGLLGTLACAVPGDPFVGHVPASADLGPAAPAADGRGSARFPSDPAVTEAVGGAFQFAAARLEATILDLEARYPADAALHYPTATAPGGQWLAGDVTDWRSGFFPGALWQMYEHTRDPAWLARARRWTAAIAGLQDRPLDHDLGFRFCLSFGNGLRLSDADGETGRAYQAAAREVLLRAAAALDTRFDMGGVPVGALRSVDGYPPGSAYPVYVDSMMNLCLLFSGWELSGAPASGAGRRWFDHALAQSRTILGRHLRPDGGTYHIVEHNDGTEGTPADGKVRRKISDQGFGPESTWSRGQAWAVYGFAQAYRFAQRDPQAGAPALLEGARRAAAYFLDHLPDRSTGDPYNRVPGDLVPPSDFDAARGEPDGPYSTHRAGVRARTPRDSSAAAAGAAGLLELCTLVPDATEGHRLFRSAEDILRSLLTFRGPDGKLAYLAKDSVHRGVLAAGAVAWSAAGAPQSLSYGDYYLLEAMGRYLALTEPPAR